ncbi:brain and acute leukemia cytoplasmic protein [Carlito syrichta]|uniref:Brain and acute leukemia cytoplasmic protein n=1 Tax=Carlito syrichta TaxID=1868482 RepID=A0A3Q0DME3_CARSF|nr:brain and acute leukemia cytoplasmic protein [Carlito syrichta]
MMLQRSEMDKSSSVSDWEECPSVRSQQHNNTTRSPYSCLDPMVTVESPLAFGRMGVLEEGLSSNGVPRSTAPGGISNPEKKMNCGTQCPNPQSLSSGPLTQKQNGLRTMEAQREAKRMPAKEVTINVTDSIRQMDRSQRITKNCVN